MPARVLGRFGVPDLDARAERYAAANQQQLLELIKEGRFAAFLDALRFILAVKHIGIRVRDPSPPSIGWTTTSSVPG